MACCSLKRDATEVSWLSLLLVCIPLELVGNLLLALLWLPGLLSAAVELRRLSLHCLLRRNRTVIDLRLTPLRWRCTACAWLLPRWPWLSGRVFKSFYVALGLMVWLAGAAGITVGIWLVG